MNTEIKISAIRRNVAAMQEGESNADTKAE